MPIVNFYLKKPEGKPPHSLIYLQFKYRGRKLVYSFGQKINPPDWSKVTKRVKSNRQTILDGRYAINELLDRLEKQCLRIYQEELVTGVPPVDLLKFRLDAFFHQQDGKQKESKLYQLFDRFISGEIKNKGKEKSSNTLRNYATAKGHLKKFDTHTRYHVHFENINLDFFHRYVSFLKNDLRLRPNSISRDIGAIKTVMSEAVESGYTSNIQFRHKKFNCPGEKTDAVILTEREIVSLYKVDCAANRRLEHIRDLFLLGCLAAQPVLGPPSNPPRHFPVPPDAASPGSSGVAAPSVIQIDGKPYIGIPIIAPGRRGLVNLPCHPIVSEILDKYRRARTSLPAPISNQKFNTYIKEIGRLAGLAEKGRLSRTPEKELWKCLSAMTARRSMATHYWRQGFPVYDLMGITGHATEKAFLGFIRASERIRGRRPD
jgi:Phage integrase SAM-like domain